MDCLLNDQESGLIKSREKTGGLNSERGIGLGMVDALAR